MMAFFGLIFVLPTVWSLGVRDGAILDFVVAAAINVVAGLTVALATRRFRRELKPRDGFLLVTLTWTLMSASASIPLMIALPERFGRAKRHRGREGSPALGARFAVEKPDLQKTP